MANPDRLSGLDASFLHRERDGAANLHVAEVLVFDGRPPGYVELLDHIRARLDLVPRYRQVPAGVPLRQGRPVWVDDPYFNLRYHVRHSGLPVPGDEASLKREAGRIFSQPLDRAKPLWEIWLVEGLEGDRFALIGKTHHVLVDGLRGREIASVLLEDDAADTSAQHAPRDAPGWVPRPVPTPAQLLAGSLLERATMPEEIGRGARVLLRAPRRAAGTIAKAAPLGWAGFVPPDTSPYRVPIGPHRRYEWVDADLETFRAIKDALGGTVNDAVLTVVAGALGRHLRLHGHRTLGLTLRALVPLALRGPGPGTDATVIGRIEAMPADLPVGETDPLAAFAAVRASLAAAPGAAEAMSAEALTHLPGFAATTIMSQAARLQAHEDRFDVAVTNVPGPQHPLFLLGREMRRVHSVVPLAPHHAVGVSVMSYAGRLGFGLLSDQDALPDLDVVAEGLRGAIADLAAAAAGALGPGPRGPRGRSRNGRMPRAEELRRP
ncbi:wax ester/triacylglycerol synthase family O-acyltransferase [Capillimicrobium parvum]|uniref:wax ester/triacylglycerol synthase family O-acyltransferase n=1 Tax=Capillimicrobium parvum TaxID=2884022 RepID=UPI00216AC872|nr:wax ester/triacylglycerol synthase family O-acyltransferase [Capillimicrobium parvum]